MRLNLLIRKRHLLYQLLISFFSLFLQITIALGEYKPNSKPSAPKSPTTATGTRGGCHGKNTTTLTAFAPQTNIGQTVSQFPTFSWFVPDSQPLPMEFRLYKYDDDASNQPQLIKKVKMVSKPGIMQLSLSQNHPGLAINQTYRWQVIIFCNPNRPSTALVTEAIIKVVKISPNLKQRLATTKNTLEKAELFAKSNFWYDALAEGFKNSSKQLGKNQQLKLLETLASLEKSPQKEQILNIINNQKNITWRRIEK
ncbi:MAG: DUF928 domain-containing protein [Waterburya sp.]